MIPLSSKIENEVFSFIDLEHKLKPLGYVMGGNWDYNHGYFDYKIDDEFGYHFLRIPFTAVDGQLDSNGTTVKLGTPFLLSHHYQMGLDDHVDVGVVSGLTNQFSEPEDADATIPSRYIQIGKELLEELEHILL